MVGKCGLMIFVCIRMLFLALFSDGTRQRDVSPVSFHTLVVAGACISSSENSGLRARTAGQRLWTTPAPPRPQAAGLVRPEMPGQQHEGSV